MGLRLLGEFAESVGLEPASVAFIGVDVDFEFERGIHADDKFVESHGERAVDFQFHGVEVLHSIVGGIVWMHVSVWLGAYDTLVHLEIAVRSHQHATGSAFDRAGHGDWNVEAEGNRIRVGELDLIEIAAGAEDAEIGNNPAAWTDEGDGFFRGVLAVLVEPLHGRELVARAEKRFHGRLRQVAVAGGDIDEQSVGRFRSLWQRQSHAGVNLFPNEVFNNSSGRGL